MSFEEHYDRYMLYLLDMMFQGRYSFHKRPKRIRRRGKPLIQIRPNPKSDEVWFEKTIEKKP